MGASQILLLSLINSEFLMIQPYKLSFTGAYFLLNESILLAERYEHLGNWEAVKEVVLEENLLQSQKVGTTQKRFNVLRGRLQTLTDEQRDLLIHGDAPAQRQILLLAVAKYHPLIRQFLEEVVRFKWLSFDHELRDADFTIFFREKQALHEQLESVKDVTAKKIKVVIYNILADCGILTNLEEKWIVQPFLAADVVRAIVNDSPDLLRIFLIAEGEIQDLITQYGSSYS